ncbi:MAG: GGDEF domain-containing protein [Deltaproteobacteria bacterium]|nr:GGDEF domain-containing protein [Deltaproteobacteria bacterium]
MTEETLSRLLVGIAIAFLSFVVLGSTLWDFVVSHEHFERLLFWRLLGGGGLRASLAGAYLMPSRRTWWLALASAVASAAFVTGAIILPSGFGYGIGGLGLVALAVAVAAPGGRSAAYASVAAGLGAALPIVVAGVNLLFVFSLAFFMAPAFVAAVGAAAAAGFRVRRRAAREHELAALRQDLERFGRTDELTGVPDKKQMERLARRELALARRRGVALSVLKLDVEGLERINEVHGRAVGDEALRAIASMCQAALRETDMLSRVAGDEFVAVVMDANAEGAKALSDRLRAKLKNAPLLAGDKLLEVTVNVGTATLAEGDQSIDDLVIRANRALNEARAQGGGDGAPGGNGAPAGATA